jgi:hypothetical protein
MNDPHATARKAAELLRHSLSRTQVGEGRQGTAYLSLVREANADPALRAALEAVASGMGLRIVHNSATAGLVLSGSGSVENPFAARAAELADRRQADGPKAYEATILLGLSLCAVVAVAFPGRAELTARSEMAAFGASDVLHCLDVAAAAATEEGGNPDVETCLRILTRLPRETPGRRTGPGSREGIVVKVLRHLKDYRCLTSMPKGEGEEQYRATDAFRHLALDAVQHPLMTAVLTAVHRSAETSDKAA